jgi:hypothetical protein
MIASEADASAPYSPRKNGLVDLWAKPATAETRSKNVQVTQLTGFYDGSDYSGLAQKASGAAIQTCDRVNVPRLVEMVRI